MINSMIKKLYVTQVLVLLGGMLFSWYTVYADFTRFYDTEGTILKIKDCVYPNPVTTPCFYGAIVFLVALAWAVYVYRDSIFSSRAKKQQKLWLILLAGTAFGWVNFGFSLLKFYMAPIGEQVTCSGVPTDNPFLTPCFWGSVIYLTAFALSWFIIKKDKGDGITRTPTFPQQ